MQSSRRSATKPDPIKTEHPLFCREIRLFIQFIRVYCFWICLTTGVQITIKWPLIRQTVDVSGFFCRNNDNQKKKPFHSCSDFNTVYLPSTTVSFIFAQVQAERAWWLWAVFCRKFQQHSDTHLVLLCRTCKIEKYKVTGKKLEKSSKTQEKSAFSMLSFQKQWI